MLAAGIECAGLEVDVASVGDGLLASGDVGAVEVELDVVEAPAVGAVHASEDGRW